MPLIEVKDLFFRYGDKVILDRICLSLKEGEVVMLLGPNGCGKTTLLDCMNGYRKYEAGSIELSGRADTSYSVTQRAQMIAYVPQSSSNVFPYTVLQMILMGRTPYLGVASSPTAKDMAIALETLDNIGMADFADRMFSSLSGGEQQLVLLARSLVQDTSIILLDEPTTSLDIKNEAMVLNKIRELTVTSHKAFIIATHQPNHAFSFENKRIPIKAALFAGKRIKYFGPPSQVINEKNIREVYNVDSRMLEYGDGQKMIVVQ